MAIAYTDRKRRGTFDKYLELRDRDASAISVTTAETAIAFNPRAQEGAKICIIADSYTGYSAGSALWTITVEASDTMSGTFTQVGGSLILTGSALETELLIGGYQSAIADDDCQYIRVKATKTGSPGNLTYGAFIVPVLT